MTIFVTTCFAITLARIIEEFVRFCINWVFRLTSKKKDREVVASEYKRLVATVTPAVYESIKTHYALMGLTVPQFTLCAVIEKLQRDGVKQ